MCNGSTITNPTTDPGGEQLNGMFYAISKVGIRNLRDGTSNTVAISETAQYAFPDEFYPNYHPDSRGMYFGEWGGSTTFSTLYPPNSAVADNVYYCVHPTIAQQRGVPCVRPSSGSPVWMSARSYHDGGVHALLADGSARFVSENINTAVCRRWDAIRQ